MPRDSKARAAETCRLGLRTTAAHSGRRLDIVVTEWLAARLGPLPPATIRRLIMAGVVRIDGRPAKRPGLPLAPGRTLEAIVDQARLRTDRRPRDQPFVLTPAAVLYEDDVLLAIDKPPGLPTVPTADPRRPSLVAATKTFLATRGPERAATGDPYLGVHQRLDRDTSGVVLFARHPAANAGLAAAFAGHTIVKTYHALVARPLRPPQRSWKVRSRLAPVGRGRVASVPSGGAPAETAFSVLETHAHGLLVEARPRTGRKHQVRVHLAEGGLGILGDAIYLPADPPGALGLRLMLHARCLELHQPVTGKALVIESPYPDDFQQALSALRRGAMPGGVARSQAHPGSGGRRGGPGSRVGRDGARGRR
jgi:RluA family pseudouridine synthase